MFRNQRLQLSTSQWPYKPFSLRKFLADIYPKIIFSTVEKNVKYCLKRREKWSFLIHIYPFSVKPLLLVVMVAVDVITPTSASDIHISAELPPASASPATTARLNRSKKFRLQSFKNFFMINSSSLFELLTQTNKRYLHELFKNNVGPFFFPQSVFKST